MTASIDQQEPEEPDRFDFLVAEGEEGQRLDAFLAARAPLSRTRLKALILQGRLRINDEICAQPNRRLAAGDRLVLDLPPAEPYEVEAEAIPLEILYEDSHIVVLVKPVGMVTHPAPGNWRGTLVNALLHHCGDSLKGIGGKLRPGIVHRLDRDTSGVMVVAKTQAAHAGLAAQFADHGRRGPLERRYLAIVWGRLEKRKGTIEAPLGRSPRERTRRAVVKESARDARSATTHYEVVGYLDGNDDGAAEATLVRCRLETGRTHQIRVHMAHIGHPLVGDAEYAAHFRTKANRLTEPARSVVTNFARQALHASHLRFRHPALGEIMEFRAEPPKDFLELLEAFKKSTPG